MFLADLYHLRPPLLSFVFTSESGRTIFEEWQKTIGKIDSQNQIAIRIIKGIDRNHPFWYRVAVGVGNYTCRPNNEPFILSLPSRSLTMQPNSDANLKMFENELKRFRHYSLCPSYMPDRSASPVTIEALTIQKGIDSIVIYEVCDIPPKPCFFVVSSANFVFINAIIEKLHLEPTVVISFDLLTCLAQSDKINAS